MIALRCRFKGLTENRHIVQHRGSMSGRARFYKSGESKGGLKAGVFRFSAESANATIPAASRGTTIQVPHEVVDDKEPGNILESFGASEPKPAAPPHQKQSLVLGTAFTAGVIALWLMAAKVNVYYPALLPQDTNMQALYLIVRYINMGAYIALFPVSLYLRKAHAAEDARHSDNAADNRSPFDFSMRLGDPAALETFKRAGLFAGLYFFTGYTYLASLQYNTIGVNTALYNMYVVFVLVLSKFVLKETVTPSKVAGVALIVLGCGALGLDASGGQLGASALGIFLITLSAMLYSVYQVGYAKWVQDAVSRPDQTLGFVAMMGLSLLCVSPIALGAGLSWGAIDMATLKLFTGSSALLMFQYLFVTSGVTIAYMLCFLAALNFSTPLFVSAGCVLVIPCSFIMDLLCGVSVTTVAAISAVRSRRHART
uniref:EamA domain-containing protein n=1 Tax=Pyramimonas obovata TaxID=1411642 RepID=A0A7S0MYS8_9CHLO|mmetsp:Transcript_16701/g.36296  ORF Transcript_16701/g.36296 Transcript_16701/m.36296 type:complete len:428 (+) Transcript_16701:180-1463(+)